VSNNNTYLYYRHYPQPVAQRPNIAIILLHGWGFHADIWASLMPALSAYRDVYVVDLPGYGRSHYQAQSLAALAAQLAQQFDFPAIWGGWSLGGMCAQQMALNYPQQVKALLLITSTPRFVQTSDWQYAVKNQVLMQFGQQLQENVSHTLQKFMRLQVQGGTASKTSLVQLEQILQRYPADGIALQQGLRYLCDSDFRNQQRHFNMPIWICLGGKDQLVPAKVLNDWLGYVKSSQIIVSHVIKTAAHVPFLSHPHEFQQQLNDFLTHYVDTL